MRRLQRVAKPATGHAWALAAASLLFVPFTTSAWAYERTFSAHGVPLYWATQPIAVHVGQPVPYLQGGGNALIWAGFRLWEGPACSNVLLVRETRARAQVKVQWIDGAWAYGETAAAHTEVVSDADTGRIIAATIRLNARHVFSNGSESAVDLQQVMAHEFGHVLGFAHHPRRSSLMYAGRAVGSRGGAGLSSDDVEGLCRMFPKKPRRD